MRRLIINADDLGITPQRSHGIFLCHEHGIVSSATISPNFSDSQRAARHAREKGLPSGLHLNLTEGAPLSKTADIKTLLTADGYFLGRETLRRVLGEGEVEREHVERELRTQFEWMIDNYGQPTHVDGHHHIHVHPVIAEILVGLFDRYGIAFTRIPSEEVPTFGFEVDAERAKKMQAISAKANKARVLFAAHGVKSADHFRGLALCGHASKRNFRHTVARLLEGTTELMVHPGSQNPAGDLFEIDPQRVTEFNMLFDEDARHELNEREIKLISYGDLY